MANKTYTVVKDGETLKELKTLAAAKKLADAEGAEVICESEYVYRGAASGPVDPVSPAVSDILVEEEKTAAAEEPEEQKTTADKYTLTRKMNVRKEPSLKADKLKVLDAGATVEVTAVINDWLCLTDGSFILYEDGKNARKA